MGIVKSAIQKQKVMMGNGPSNNKIKPHNPKRAKVVNGQAKITAGSGKNKVTHTITTGASLSGSASQMYLEADGSVSIGSTPKKNPKYTPKQTIDKMTDMVKLADSGDVPYIIKEGDLHPTLNKRLKTIKNMLIHLDRRM